MALQRIDAFKQEGLEASLDNPESNSLTKSTPNPEFTPPTIEEPFKTMPVDTNIEKYKIKVKANAKTKYIFIQNFSKSTLSIIITIVTSEKL